MKKRIILFLMFHFVFLFKMLGCLSASQERIFPLGTDGMDGLLVIEAQCHRYGMGEFGSELFWNYKTVLKSYNKDYTSYVVSKLDSNFLLKEEQIDSFIKKQTLKALKVCDTIEGFEKFEIETISFCDFQQDCSQLKIVGDGEIIGVKLAYENTIHPVIFLYPNFKSSSTTDYRNLRGFSDVEADDSVGYGLMISSLRKYKNSKHELIVFHLGTGHEFKDPETDNYYPKKEYLFEEEIISIEETIPEEPILHHGAGFDYYILLDKSVFFERNSAIQLYEKQKKSSLESLIRINNTKDTPNSVKIKEYVSEIHEKSVMTLEYIDSLKNELINQSGGKKKGVYVGMSDVESVNNIFIENKEGDTLENKLNVFVKELNSIYNQLVVLSKDSVEVIYFPLLTDFNPDFCEGKSSFGACNFKDTFMIASISYLEDRQGKAASYERYLLNYAYSILEEEN